MTGLDLAEKRVGMMAAQMDDARVDKKELHSAQWKGDKLAGSLV